MASLFFNFLKRTILIPVLVTAIVLAVLYYNVPKILNTSISPAPVSASVDISQYNVKDFNSFAELSPGDYVGTISCESINLGETAVVYQSDSENVPYVAENSSEPWNGGSVIIIGSDTSSQFGKFYNSEKGDKIKLEFYSKDAYTYKIKNKEVGVSYDKIKKYEDGKNLIIAVPYNDFSNLGNSYFYTLYIARKA